MTKFIAIAAVSVDGVIGIGNEIPWKLPEDFKHFRKTTMGNVLLVGYNTYLTLPEKAFEGRKYIVLTGDNVVDYSQLKGDTRFCKDFEVAKYFIDAMNAEKVFIIGGAMVYESLIDWCDEAIITWVNKYYPNGTKRFPIEKLFTNFEELNNPDWNWKKAENGILYKITKYIKR